MAHGCSKTLGTRTGLAVGLVIITLPTGHLSRFSLEFMSLVRDTSVKMAKRVCDSEIDLIKKLDDVEFAVEYLNASLEESDQDAEERFLLALRHAAKTHGMTAVAERSGMARQAMYRALPPRGNPALSSLKALLSAMGLGLAVERKKATP